MCVDASNCGGYCPECVNDLRNELKAARSKLGAALDELRQLYRDDGCTAQEIEDQLQPFLVERGVSK